jgi:hypothetical protein
VTEFDHVTTDAAVDVYESSVPIFRGILREVRELSKKRPETTMSAGKVKIVNRVLSDLLVVLKDEPAGKYLEVLNDEALPQMSDAVLAMVQFESALASFHARYHKYVGSKQYWITQEIVAAWNEDSEEPDADNEE